jgi:ribose transport system permease protein
MTPLLPDSSPAVPQFRERLAKFAWTWLAPFLGLAIVLVFFYTRRPDAFLTAINIKIVAAQTASVAICAIGMTFILIGGGIDLSVGSVMALCSVFLALTLQRGYSTPVAIAVAVTAGAVVGLVNGVLITSLRIIPFVVTLGMLGIARGLAKALAHNRPVRLDFRPDALADFVQPLRSPAWWDFAPSVWLMLAVAVVAAVVLNMTRFGRRTYALGSNETAARFSGISVDRQKWMLYALGGLLTGLAGVLLFANIVEGDPTAAAGIELQVIAAVVIGGGSLMGGEGSIMGTLIGAFMLTFLVNGCTLAQYPNWVQEIVIGVIIVLAVALDYFRQRAPR